MNFHQENGETFAAESRGFLLRRLTSCVKTELRDTLAQKSLQIGRAGTNPKWASFARNVVEQIQCLLIEIPKKFYLHSKCRFALSKFIRPS